jgi:RHS repeat-associated protein
VTVATVEGGSTTYVHTDHLGGTTLTTDNTGAVTQTLDYFPYGETRIETGLNDEDAQYTGYKKDSTTGLNYASARYYNPSRGAFISQDPVALALGYSGKLNSIHNVSQAGFLRDPQLLNSYGYARNNPLKYNDPSGEIPILVAVPFVLKAAGAALTAYSAYDAVQQTESNIAEYGVAGGLALTGSGFALDAVIGKLKIVDKAVDGIGGAYKNVKGKIKGNEAHHMPADSVSPISKGEGPAISMDKADHRQTASWGRGLGQNQYRANQSYLIGTGRYMDAFEMDVNDVQSKFGSRYDDAIKQAREQAKKVDKKTKK